jgi:hypothetical protein
LTVDNQVSSIETAPSSKMLTSVSDAGTQI